VVWLSLGSLNTTCFVPFYQGVTQLPESYLFGDHWEFDRRVARWAFDYVDYHSYVAYSYAIQDIREAQARFETAAVERTADIDATAMKRYKESPDKAKEYLTQYSCDNANTVVNAWWKLGDDLLVKYNHLFIYEAEGRKRGSIKYDEDYLRALVKYNNLKPVGEKH